MKLRYKLNEEAVKKLFIDAQEYGAIREVNFEPGNVSESVLRAWYEMFGTRENATLQPFFVEEKNAWSDYKPDITQYNSDHQPWLEQDHLLSEVGTNPPILEDAQQAILELYAQYQQTLQQLPAAVAEWEKAHAEYLAKEVQRKEQEKAIETAKDIMRPDIDRLAKRVSELEGYLTALIKVSGARKLEAAGLYKASPEESEYEETTPEQQEAGVNTVEKRTKCKRVSRRGNSRKPDRLRCKRR